VPLIGELWRRLLYLVRRDRMTAELEEEMRLHVAMRAESLARAGTPHPEATFAAQRRFGNRTTMQQESRAMWGMHLPEQFTQDFRIAVRRLSQRKGFAFGVIAVLALGIGATTAMFSAVDAAMLRPLPFPDAGRLVILRHVSIPFDAGQPEPQPAGGQRRVELPDVAEMKTTFAAVAAYASGGLNISDPDRPVRANAGVVTEGFFRAMGVAPERGRAFAHEETVPGGPKAVILSHALAERWFAGRDAVGQAMQLNSKSYTIVGVMPAGFAFPDRAELWIPMSVPNTFDTFEAFRGFLPSFVIARVAAGVTVETASAQMRTAWDRAMGPSLPIDQRTQDYDDTGDDVRASGALTTLQTSLAANRRTALLVLLGATGFLLLIACANVTNLLLAHGASRHRELAVRGVLGATRGRIVRQLLIESVVLSAAGTAVGLALAPIALRVIGALMPARLAGVADAHIDLRVLGFATMLAALTAIAFGLWPALGSTRAAAMEMIKWGSGHGATSLGAAGMRRLLVGAELALALMLLVGAGLMLRSFQTVMAVETGMTVDRVATLEMALPRGSGPAPRLAKLQAILDRMQGTPGIEVAGAVNDLPLRGGGGISIRINTPLTAKGERAGARQLMASPGYFAALGVRFIEGRNFGATDDSLSPNVAVINRAMAEQYWPGQSALGRTFRVFSDVTVIGVVENIRETAMEREPPAQMFYPITRSPPINVAFVARGTMPPAALMARMVEAVRSVDAAQAVFNVKMMDDVVRGNVAPRRANTILIAMFAGLALLLAAVGVYAVVSYGVTQRTRELGIRSALGATGPELVQMIAREMGWVTAIGLAVGLAGAWALSRVLSTLVYGIGTHDPATFVLVPIALAVPALVATLVPARRALRVNPAEVMRAE